ncbi:leucine-rich repeat protein [Rummeliibacillus pycnus]|uniref:leucine-rich repeat protein n=1 Tax=Rummeliibacillus pycnus TaxID=101070 RepID=UPI003D2A9829
MIKTRFKRHFVSMLAIALMLITLISPLNIAHAATSSDGKYEYTVLGDGTIEINRYLGSSISLSIPSSIDGYKVTVLGDHSFRENGSYYKYTSITIPNTVTTIGTNAFFDQYIENITIPDSVTSIGDYAFYSNNIKDLVIGENVKTIGVNAFSENNLSMVFIPDSVISIGSNAFLRNQITGLTFGKNVKTIGASAFNDNLLTSVTIPDSVISIGSTAFNKNNITKFYVKNANMLYGSSSLAMNPNMTNGLEKDVVIYAAKGSTSETYANANGHTFYTSSADEQATKAVEKAESSLSQSDLNNAQSLVNNVEDPTAKANLQKRLDAVQNKINQKQALATATAAVEQAESSLKTNDLITAQGLVNVLEDITAKSDLQSRLDAVQKKINQQQNEKDATSAVEQAESTHSQADLDKAKNLVNALPSGSVKDDLLNRLDAVQKEIDGNNQENSQKESDATNAVEQAESTHNQADLDHAKDLVNALPDSPLKDNLLDRLDAVQKEIDGTNNGDVTEGSSTATNDVNFTLDGGELSLKNSDVVSFGKVKLVDQPKSFSTSFTDKFVVRDLTGNQLGYRVDVSATPFTDGKNTLPKGTLSLKPVTLIERVGLGSGASPVSSMSSNQIIDNGKVTLVSAAEGTGMGVFNLTFPSDALSITVDPTTAKINGASSTYSSTVTWDLIQAP